MKSSRFNYILKYKDDYIMYNTFSRRLLMLEPTLVDLYEAAVKNSSVTEIQQYHPTFYHRLIEDKFIIDETIDETEQVRKVMDSIDKNDSSYHLIINPTMNCNFKCWYCYESHIKESKMGLETIQHIVGHLKSVLKGNKNIKRLVIGWFGGEPLLYFDKVMLPIMQQVDELAKQHGIAFVQNITSNGFLIKEKMIAYFKAYNLSHFQITLDGSKFLHDTIRFVSKNRGSYDDIVSNIKMLVRNKLPVTTRINFTKATLTNVEDIYEDFKELSSEDLKYLDLSFHQVWQEKDANLNDRVDELVSFFRQRGIGGKNAYVPDTLINSCYADRSNHATINYDGNVFKCTARDFNVNNREGVLNSKGEIEWNEKFYTRMDIKLKNKPCHSCGILPLCNGGCSQHAIEANGKDFCVYDFDENVKRDLVYRKVENILMKQVVV